MAAGAVLKLVPSRASLVEIDMQFMVIEHFKDGDPLPIYRRFKEKGRMFPEDGGLTFVSSWIDVTGTKCFQIMECDDIRQLQKWMLNWMDIVEFEVFPILPGKDFAEVVAPRL